MNNKKYAYSLVLISIFALSACRNVRDLEVSGSSAFTPKLAVEKSFGKRGRLSLEAQTLSVTDDNALELYGARQIEYENAQPTTREADIFHYGGVLITGAELGSEGVNDPRIFASDTTYTWVDAGLWGRFGNETIAFVPGVFFRSGRAGFDVVEQDTGSPERFSINVSDLSVGGSLGVSWRFHSNVEWETHLAYAGGGSQSSMQLETQLRFGVTDNIDLSYGFTNLFWQDGSNESLLLLNAAGQQLGLIYRFD